jgi:hypothetical protein
MVEGRRSREAAPCRGAWHRVVEDTAAVRSGRLDRQAAMQHRFRRRLDSPGRAAVHSVAGRRQFGSHLEPGRYRGARHPAYMPSAAGRCRDIAARMPGRESSRRQSITQAPARFAVFACGHPLKLRPAGVVCGSHDADLRSGATNRATNPRRHSHHKSAGGPLSAPAPAWDASACAGPLLLQSTSGRKVSVL